MSAPSRSAESRTAAYVSARRYGLVMGDSDGRRRRSASWRLRRRRVHRSIRRRDAPGLSSRLAGSEAVNEVSRLGRQHCAFNLADVEDDRVPAGGLGWNNALLRRELPRRNFGIAQSRVREEQRNSTRWALDGDSVHRPVAVNQSSAFDRRRGTVSANRPDALITRANDRSDRSPVQWAGVLQRSGHGFEERQDIKRWHLSKL